MLYLKLLNARKTSIHCIGSKVINKKQKLRSICGNFSLIVQK